jgi:hypothetical protein
MSSRLFSHLKVVDVTVFVVIRILKVYYENQKACERKIFAIYYLSGLTTNGVYQMTLVPEHQLNEKLKEFPHPSFYIYALSSKPIIVRSRHFRTFFRVSSPRK